MVRSDWLNWTEWKHTLISYFYLELKPIIHLSIIHYQIKKFCSYIYVLFLKLVVSVITSFRIILISVVVLILPLIFEINEAGFLQLIVNTKFLSLSVNTRSRRIFFLISWNNVPDIIVLTKDMVILWVFCFYLLFNSEWPKGLKLILI